MEGCSFVIPSKKNTTTSVETVVGNFVFNNINFPPNPAIGSVHIVDFDNGLYIYKFTISGWSQEVVYTPPIITPVPILRTWVGNIINQGTFAPEVQEVFSNIGTLPLVNDDVQVYTITGFFLFTGTPLITVIYPHTIDYYGDVLYTTVDQVIVNNVTPGVNLVNLTITVKDSLGNPFINIGAAIPMQIIVGDNFIETIVE